jgi:hypothetical protein
MKLEKNLLGGRKRASPLEIIFLKSDANYTNVHLVNGKKHFVATTVGTLENCLKDCRFFKTHRSILVNLVFLENNHDKETFGEISLINKTKILISRRKNKTFKTMKLKFLALAMCSLLYTSCGRATIDPINDVKCDKEQDAYLKAVNAWVSDPTSKVNCEATKNALNNLIKSCTILSTLERKKYQDELKDFTCN